MALVAIVITGLPAGGKTTVAKRIAVGLNWPLLDKDDFLENLFASASVESFDDRRRLSKLSDEAFQAAAKMHSNAVLVSHWRPIVGRKNTGTDPDFVNEHFDKIIEVHCVCSVETAAKRFRTRIRHHGHMDKRKSEEDVKRQIQLLSKGYPLGIGFPISVETENPVDYARLLSQIKSEICV